MVLYTMYMYQQGCSGGSMRPWYQRKISPAQCVVSVKHLQNQGWYSNIPRLVFQYSKYGQKSIGVCQHTPLLWFCPIHSLVPRPSYARKRVWERDYRIRTIPAMLVNAPTLRLLASPCCQDCADVEASSVGDPAGARVPLLP